MSGRGDAAQLAEALHAERGGLWLLLALSLANVVLAVWRHEFTGAIVTWALANVTRVVYSWKTRTGK